MTKKEYLNQLMDALSDCDASIQAEILSNYHEHFEIGFSQGKSEEEIVVSLGSIEELLAELRDFKVEQNPKQHQPNTTIPNSTSGMKSKRIVLSALTADVMAYRSKDQYIQADFTNYGSAKEKLLYEFVGEQTDDTLYLKVQQKERKLLPFMTINPPRMTIDLAVPAGIEFLQIDSLSGECELNDMEVKEIKVKTISGDVTMNHSKCDSIKLETTSGDMDLNDIHGNLVVIGTSGDINADHIHGFAKISSISGDIELHNHAADKVELSSVSGELSYDGFAKSIISKTTSGDIEIEATQNIDLIAKTVSGDIDVVLPADCNGMELNFQSVSGEVQSSNQKFRIRGRRGAYQFGTSDSKLNVSTVSGDLTIR